MASDTSVPSSMRPPSPQSPSTTATSLPTPRRIITGHDPETGHAIIQQIDSGHWDSIANNTSRYNVLWTTSSFPINIDSNTSPLNLPIKTGSLSLPNGSVLRIVERAPHSEGPMHRTQSLDYGIVLDGEWELLLDSGQKETLRKGDVCIQRGTMHQWNNRTAEWARMVFVLMDAEPLEVAGLKFEGETGLEHIKEINRRD